MTRPMHRFFQFSIARKSTAGQFLAFAIENSEELVLSALILVLSLFAYFSFQERLETLEDYVEMSEDRLVESQMTFYVLRDALQAIIPQHAA